MELQQVRNAASYSPPRSSTPSGIQTPREVREERWKQESDLRDGPSKVEMRERYKELGGRKVKGKGRLPMGVGGGGSRDRGGWEDGMIDD